MSSQREKAYYQDDEAEFQAHLGTGKWSNAHKEQNMNRPELLARYSYALRDRVRWDMLSEAETKKHCEAQLAKSCQG